MKKLKYLSVMLLTIIFLLAACGSGDQTPSDEAAANETTTPTTEETLQDEETKESETELTIEDRLADLIRDEYEGIEITAEVLERKAILPGSIIPVNVTIRNNGEQTIVFPHGSSSSELPEALIVDAPLLQPVLSESQLGIATLDMVNTELKPGEELIFVVNVMAITPNEDFDTYTLELYNESETYIGNMTWEEIQAQFPSLTAVTKGSFDIHVYFTYYILTEETQADATASATGYAQGNLTITVTE